MQPHSSNGLHLDSGEIDLKVRTYTDGTTSYATVADVKGPPTEYLADGFAKRRKGEQRDPDLGNALAISRALYDLADRYMKLAEGFLK